MMPPSLTDGPSRALQFWTLLLSLSILPRRDVTHFCVDPHEYLEDSYIDAWQFNHSTEFN